MLSRSLLAILGTWLEWAEYTFYAYMAPVLAELFFPQAHASTALISVYAIFALGYFMRPLGGIIFGHIGDTFGRRPALMLSLLLMAGATACIGILPTHAQWGPYAALLLGVCRLLQGFAMGGEYLGASIYLIEHTQRYRCFAGSLIACAAACGMVTGAIASFIISAPDMPSWAWRIPFILAGTLCLLGYYWRQQLEETPEFTRAPRQALPLLTVLKHYRRPLLRVGMISGFIGIYVYICNIYYISFLMHESNLSHHLATRYALIGQVMVAILIPLMGWWADKTHPHRLFGTGLLLSAACSPLIFYTATTGSTLLIGSGLVLYALINALTSGPMLKILYDAFPTSTRYSGMGLAYNIGAVLFSGTALIVAQTLRTWTGAVLSPAYYVAAFSLLTFVIFIRTN